MFRKAVTGPFVNSYTSTKSAVHGALPCLDVSSAEHCWTVPVVDKTLPVLSVTPLSRFQPTQTARLEVHIFRYIWQRCTFFGGPVCALKVASCQPGWHPASLMAGWVTDPTGCHCRHDAPACTACMCAVACCGNTTTVNTDVQPVRLCSWSDQLTGLVIPADMHIASLLKPTHPHMPAQAA